MLLIRQCARGMTNVRLKDVEVLSVEEVEVLMIIDKFTRA